MKAIIKKEPTVGVWMDEVPMPTLGAREVLIKMIKTSICGTDVHLYKWDAWARKTLPVPSIIGHEFVGEVVEVGRDVSSFKKGDRVSGEGHLTCGHCRMCRTGRRVLCPHTIGIGVNRDGCFAEYLALPEENAFLVPASIPDEVASIFDPLGNAVHTALSCDLVGKDVLITGAGPIGLMAIPVALRAGARHVVVSDINPYRLQLATELGATRAVDVRQKGALADAMHALAIREGFDVCLEMSGSAEAFASLPAFAAHGAQLVLLGILPEQATIDWHQVIFKMLTIKGIYGREIFRTWYQAAALLETGLPIAPIITHKFHASEYQKGFDVMLSGNSGKVVLDWSF